MFLVVTDHFNELCVVGYACNQLNVEGSNALWIFSINSGQSFIELLRGIATLSNNLYHFFVKQLLVFFVDLGVFEWVIINLLGCVETFLKFIDFILNEVIEYCFSAIIAVTHPKSFKLTNYLLNDLFVCSFGALHYYFL